LLPVSKKASLTQPDRKVACADRLQASALHLLRLLRKLDALTGVSGGQLAVLSHLAYDGPTTIGELARIEEVRSPTMTQLVSGLAREGLVERQSGSADRRHVHVRITPQGRGVLNEWRARRIRPLAEMLAQLPVRESTGVDRSFELVEQLLARAIEQAFAPGAKLPESKRRGRRDSGRA
jgi:DNA-binding MarR family transcriptional regulator